mgnify:FL=1
MTEKPKRFRNVFVALGDTNLTSVYTCPSNVVGVIKEIIVCNVDGSASADITLQITDTSASATFSLASTKAVAQDTFLRFEQANIVIEAGDIFKAQASAGGDLHVSLFVEEHYDPNR